VVNVIPWLHVNESHYPLSMLLGVPQNIVWTFWGREGSLAFFGI